MILRHEPLPGAPRDWDNVQHFQFQCTDGRCRVFVDPVLAAFSWRMRVCTTGRLFQRPTEHRTVLAQGSSENLPFVSFRYCSLLVILSRAATTEWKQTQRVHRSPAYNHESGPSILAKRLRVANRFVPGTFRWSVNLECDQTGIVQWPWVSWAPAAPRSTQAD